ncbi:MAG: exodeoxyribonuclease VII large subunit [Bacteroidales bacterium]|jgi:exodeoxyribonuclease VII large subunit|nr:exodeoxyribonuclease VII large subunit [Bacteroidales bacterium]
MQNINENAISLYDLAMLIRRTIDQGLPNSYLVTAEIQSLSVNRSGHAYLELVQKSETGDRVISQARATIWAGQYRMVKAYFESTTGRLFQAGIRIMVKAKVTYHEIYGLSLNITDILPEYTIGEIALQRQKTINQLKADGIYDMNKGLRLPMLVQRIAVISSATAAGYGDFCKQLHGNPYGYAFRTTLFEAIVQGDGAAASIIPQLDHIAEIRDQFDCVVIIRGGGSKTDLACFDQLSICQHICQFPLPVITGIGHDRDESIADLVANTPLKTPTAVAQFLIDRAHGCDMAVNAKSAAIMRKVAMAMSGKAMAIDRTWDRIVNKIKNRLVQAQARIQMIETRIEANSPARILRRGYTYITIDGKPITSAAQLKKGQSITTVFHDGTADATVENITIN